MFSSVAEIEVVINTLGKWLHDTDNTSVYATFDTTISVTYFGFKIKVLDPDSNGYQTRILHMLFDPHQREQKSGILGQSLGLISGGVSVSMISFNMK